MLEQIERVLCLYESRQISRREAVGALGTMALAMSGITTAGVAADDGDDPATFTARSLNHIALRVTDVNRSRGFYGKHLGLEVIRQDSDARCFMSCGDHFVALFQGDRPGLDHFCFTVDDYDADAMESRLREAKRNPTRREDRVYFDDPDGIELQLSGKSDAWPGPRPR